MLLPVSVAGASAHVGKTKAKPPGSPVSLAGGAGTAQGVCAAGSGSQSCPGPALHPRGLCLTLGDFRGLKLTRLLLPGQNGVNRPNLWVSRWCRSYLGLFLLLPHLFSTLSFYATLACVQLGPAVVLPVPSATTCHTPCKSPQTNHPAKEEVSLEVIVHVGPGHTKVAITSWAQALSCSLQTLA